VFFETHAANDVPVSCKPPSGAVFSLGKTFVSCASKDPATDAIGLGRFPVTVQSGAAVLRAPDPGFTVEATSPRGANLAAGVVTAIDAAHGPLEVSCDPPLSTVLPLDKETPVTCRVTDARAATQPSASFSVRVRDTTPPVLCPLPDQGGPTEDPKGIEVSFKTCADDAVDGRVGVSCNHPSGSFFPLGRTEVTCSAVDRHGNRSVPVRFMVWVRAKGSGWDPSLRK
jgi:hypothetical protein